MTLIPEPYYLTVSEVDWVARALSTDSHRRVLTVAALAYYDGEVVLVATDNYRLHLLRLGPVEAEFPWKLLDLRRVLFEARFYKATHIQIPRDFSEIIVGKRDAMGNFEEMERIHAPVFDTVAMAFPNFPRVIPTTKRPVSEFFAINARYLADATLLSRQNAFRTVIYSEGANRPLAFRGDDARWLAVVMPMDFSGIGEEMRK